MGGSPSRIKDALVRLASSATRSPVFAAIAGEVLAGASVDVDADGQILPDDSPAGDLPKADAAKTGSAKTGDTKPDAAKPDAAKPDAARPDAARPPRNILRTGPLKEVEPGGDKTPLAPK